MRQIVNTESLEEVHCDLCGSNRYRLSYTKPDTWLKQSEHEFRIVKCCDCGLVFVNPRPTPEAMSAYYPKDYHYGRDSKEHQKRYSLQETFLPPLNESNVVLDIGCARGDWLIFLRNKHPKITCVGIDYYSEDVTDPGIEYHKKLLTDCGFQDATFDLVTAWAVFEHLHTPMTYFEEIARILKPGGAFVFLVTNAESLYGRAAYIEDVPRHTYHYSKKTLRRYADSVGLKFESCVYDDRLFDGRGRGTFRYTLLKLTGWTWRNLFSGKYTRFQALAARIGLLLDKLVFSTHWESRVGCSGIIIATMIKPK